MAPAVQQPEAERIDPLEVWHLCDALSVLEAALLMVGADPAEKMQEVDCHNPSNPPVNYKAAFAALTHAISSEFLKADVVRFSSSYSLGEGTIIDWSKTRVAVTDIKAWLATKPQKPKFFFPDDPPIADYLDRSHPHYSKKLAAAVEAWQAVSQERSKRNSGRTVKTDLARWLNERARHYGLTNESAIDEVAKVANWHLKGGAPKSRGSVEIEVEG